jgi:FkbH-like protein
LVVDCDNTLWGGVLGEDGIDGIQIGKGFPGQFFTDFQKELKYLKDSGYLLAIASKNNVDEVKDAIQSNRQMILKIDDFSVIKSDWYEKSTMLQEIANELNLGIDSLVFIDDSDTEISEVSSALPETKCIQIPKDVSELSGLLGSQGICSPRMISEEDKVRTDLIKSENSRTEFKRTALSREEYLESLKLSIEVGLATDSHVQRVVQLINKTNQFNISTRRRSLVEVESLLSNEAFRVYYLNANDRFGEYGLVGVLILKVSNSMIHIDTFLLSCRILGREVERSFLISAIVSEISHSVRGIEKICADLIETPKNIPARDFLPELGFKKLASTTLGTTEYAIDLEAFLEILVPSHIRVEVKK